MPFNSERGIVHILALLLLLVGIGITVYLLNQTQIFRSKASDSGGEIARLTDQITQKVVVNQLEFASDEKLAQDVLDLARTRQALLLKEIPKNPEILIENQLSEDTLSKLPAKASAFVERRVDESGVMDITHIDGFKDKKSLNIYKFKGQNSGTLDVYFPYGNNFVNETSLEIKGLLLSDKLVVESITPKTDSKPTVGNLKYLVLPVNFTDIKHQAGFKERLQGLMFGDKDSVKSYYKTQSNSKLLMVGETRDILEIPFNSDFDKCDYKARLDYINSKNPDASNFTSVIYVFPESLCLFDGLEAQGLALGGSPSKALIFSHNNLITTIIHELGHTLGLDHAKSLFCRDKFNFSVEGCSPSDYGDFTSIMGSGDFPVGLNAPELEQLGWLEGKQITNLRRGGGGYNLFALNSGSDENKVVKIQRAASIPYYWTNQFLYLSYPVNEAIDKTFSGGINMTLAGKFLSGVNTPTYIISGQAPTGMALVDNMLFHDKLANIDITQRFHNNYFAHVFVHIKNIKDKYGINVKTYLANNPPLDHRTIPVIITATKDVSEELKKWGIKVRSVIDNGAVIMVDTDVYGFLDIALIPEVTSLDIPEKLYLTQAKTSSCQVEWGGISEQMTPNTDYSPVIRILSSKVGSEYVSVYLDDKRVEGGSVLSGKEFKWLINSGSTGIHKLSFKINDWDRYKINPQDLSPTATCTPTYIYESTDRKPLTVPVARCEVEWEKIEGEYQPNVNFTVKGKITSSDVGRDYISVYVDGQSIEGGQASQDGFSWGINSGSPGQHLVQLKVNDWVRYKISGQDSEVSQFCGGDLTFTTK